MVGEVVMETEGEDEVSGKKLKSEGEKKEEWIAEGGGSKKRAYMVEKEANKGNKFVFFLKSD